MTSSRLDENRVGVRARDLDARHAARLADELLRPQQRLRRHAGVERALAADEVLLDERDLHPMALGQPPRGNLARGPSADDDCVVGVRSGEDNA